ncbi:MAG: hypothetical protein WC651_05010 [Candidatus Gracilibacteria bacterium]|jgi:small-conductance mechanosensitive channel
MEVFKYIVANKDGKKLTGTVEAPDEQTARVELNNLGFSILTLEKTQELPKHDESLIKYIFEAIDSNSKLVSGTIPAKDPEEAFSKLTSGYSLIVTAIWKEGASEQEINEARKKGNQKMQEFIEKKNEEDEKQKTKSIEQQKEEAFVKEKIENLLKEINTLLVKFDQDFSLDQKMEIDKKLNKLLRIKNSTNLNYILETAEDLLNTIKTQEQTLVEKGYFEKKMHLEMETQKLIKELHKSSAPTSLSEDIISKIDNWKKTHVGEKKENIPTKLLEKILTRIKKIFEKPPQIVVIEEQIRAYNHQLWEFAKMYFKEPTKEYKDKVKNALKTIWAARKKAVHSLAQAKALLKGRDIGQKTNLDMENFVEPAIEELNSLTGWLLVFYLIYYFISIIITTKNLGFTVIPQGFFVYKSHIFKYILGILFLTHAATSLKINFFKKNIIANILLPTGFVFGSVLILLNF